MVTKDRFDALLGDAGLAGDYEKFSVYCGMLQEWNQRMNLTAITDDEGVAVKHFLDSLLPLTMWQPPEGAALIDVGTGAGFPGVPMKLLRPDLSLTLLDSLQKRLNFLDALCGELGVKAALVHARAEDAGRSPHHRERYDVATSRAVAGMGILAEYCLPLLRVGGVLLALKGSSGKEEAREGGEAIALCGGRVQEVKEYTLPGGDKRTLVVVEKVSATPKKYPRRAGQLRGASRDTPPAAAGNKSSLL